MSILLRFVLEFMSIKRYSAPGVYSTMGLCWLSASSATAKTDKICRMLDFSPPLSRLELWLPMLFWTDVWMGMLGGRLEAKTIEATGFHNAMLVISGRSRSIVHSTVVGVI
jgi:hypothetical protein